MALHRPMEATEVMQLCRLEIRTGIPGIPLIIVSLMIGYLVQVVHATLKLSNNSRGHVNNIEIENIVGIFILFPSVCFSDSMHVVI